MFATGGTLKKSESQLVQKQLMLLNSLPINLQKGYLYQSCIDWQHHSTVWEYSVLWSSFLVNFNHSHNGNMVKDKHEKALDFMVNMKFGDSCIGFAAETKRCSCLVQFLGEEIIPSNTKDFLTAHSTSYDLWNGIVEDDDEEMMKDKVIDFLNSFRVVSNAKDFFVDFQVIKDQSSVTEVMHICLPTTCKLLGIPRHIGQPARQLCCAKRSCHKGSFNCG